MKFSARCFKFVKICFFRDIREPKQVKLVYDVLKFDPPEIEKAVLFATNNALVCETPEDAMKVAYEIDRSRYDVSVLRFPNSHSIIEITQRQLSYLGFSIGRDIISKVGYHLRWQSRFDT